MMKSVVLVLMVLLCETGSLWAAPPVVNLVPPPGSYSGPVSVRVETDREVAVTYRFQDSEAEPELVWKSPLELDVAPGECRTFSLRVSATNRAGESVVQDVQYLIQRSVGPFPTLSPPPGLYADSVQVTGYVPTGWAILDGSAPVVFPIQLVAEAGSRKVVQWTVVDPQGTQRPVTYTFDRRKFDDPQLEVVSPRPGTWQNAQSLWVVPRGLDSIRWNWGSTTDDSSSIYSGPEILNRSGDLVVTISGRIAGTSRWISKTIAWSQETNSLSSDWPDSGASSTGFTFPGIAGAQVSWDDGVTWTGSRGRSDVAGDRRSLRAVQLDTPEGRYRYVYGLDARPTPDADVEVTGGWNPRIWVRGEPDLTYSVRWSSPVDPPSSPLAWGPVASWVIPDGARTATVTWRRNDGEERSAQVELAMLQQFIPGWEPIPGGLMVRPRTGLRAVYELASSSAVPEPSRSSAYLDDVLVPPVAKGQRTTIYARLAWRDESGVVGPASDPIPIVLSRINPPLPNLQWVAHGLQVSALAGAGGRLLIETPEFSRGNSPSGPLTSLPAEKSLTLPDDATLTGGTWSRIQQADPWGNLSPSTGLLRIPDGNDTNAVPIQMGERIEENEQELVSGAVIPWSHLSLRNSENSGDLWVAAMPGNSIPDGWDQFVQTWDKPLRTEFPDNGRSEWIVYWNKKTSDGWAWEQPHFRTFVVDRTSPAPLVWGHDWPTGPIAGPWALDPQPGKTGDTILYTMSDDGTEPADPTKVGIPWTGAQTWTVASGQRRVLSFRFATVSVSGQCLESERSQPVILDRTAPVAVHPPMELVVRAQGQFRIPDFFVGELHYTLTSDGSAPDFPSRDSERLTDDGLILASRSAEDPTVYRLRWRAFSAIGEAGPVSDVYTVVVSPSSALVDNSRLPSGAALRLVGVPSSGMSNSPLVAHLDVGRDGTRYELSEGLAGFQSVTGTSTLWSGDLTLDPGEGRDQNYFVALRTFDSEGNPLSAELRYQVRIDRRLPDPPEFTLQSLANRSEGRVVVVAPDADEQVWWRWKWLSFPGTSEGHQDWIRADNSQGILTPPPGTLTRWTVDVQLRDEAGNLGPIVSKELLLDRDVVYVGASDKNRGTRDQPMANLNDAIELAHRQGRTLVLFAKGSYSVSAPIEASGLRMIGGLDTNSWEQSDTRDVSRLIAQAPFRGTSMIQADDSSWTLSGVSLETGFVALKSVVDAGNSTVRLDRVTGRWYGVGWVQSGGTLVSNQVSIVAFPTPSSPVFQLNGVQWKFSDWTITATGNQDGPLVSLAGSNAVGQNLKITSHRALGWDSVFDLKESSFSLVSSQIYCGDGSDYATAISSQNSHVKMTSVEMYLYATRSNTGFSGVESAVEGFDTLVQVVNGDEFNRAVVSSRGSVQWDQGQIKISSGAYQGAFTITQAKLSVTGGRVELSGGGRQAWGGQFTGTCTVGVDATDWVLKKPTPGGLWLGSQGWTPESTVNRLSVQGFMPD